MTTTTKAGDDLAWKLNPAIGTTREIAETCSRIHRLAVSYSRIQERWCNEEMSDRTTARLEVREANIEKRITRLVESLPHADPNENGEGGAWRVMFDGDPRGNTVQVLPPAGWEHLADNWNQRGIGADN